MSSPNDPMPNLPPGCLGGWVNDPDECERIQSEMRAAGHVLDLPIAAPHLFGGAAPLAAGNESVFFWEAEEKVLGKRLPAWNQNPIGSCVGFGSTRAAQDTYLMELANGESEVWPGAEFCPEATYVGSRNESWPPNYSKIRPNSDGSVGVAAANWFVKFGIVVRAKYPSVDLTTYNRDWTRANQGRGVPDDIETAAKLRPISTAALLTTFDDVWAAIGAGKGVFFCSALGFTMQADSEGYAMQSGKWGHCQAWRGRFTHPSRGPSVVGINSWLERDGGRPLHPSNGPVTVQTVDRGAVQLPPGHIAYTKAIVERILRERETFALAGVTGWKPQKLTWNPLQ